MLEFWNKRYAEEEFVYGKEPNEFLRLQLEELPKGKIIFPCDGEGRNAVFSANLGWAVKAFDFSPSAKKKAEALAKAENVEINYEVSDIFDKEYQGESADVVALIYAHFPKELRKVAHQKAVQWLKPGGRIILEAFNTEQINNSSGGPKNIEMLYTKEMLAEDFKELHLVKLETIKTNLSEGDYHRGQADVVRLIAIK